MTAPLKINPAALLAQFPACFDFENPRPLKIGIRWDLIRLLQQEVAEQLSISVNSARVRLFGATHIALAHYCNRPRYLQALTAGAERIDLTGQVVGVVTEIEATQALKDLQQSHSKRHRPPSLSPVTPPLPEDAPLTAENIVAGRLELTVKFSELPKPIPVKAGMKIGIQTDSALVVMTIPNKTWKKLEKAKTNWPAWVAMVTGKLGAQVASPQGTIVMLDSPAVQVFEKKVKTTT